MNEAQKTATISFFGKLPQDKTQVLLTVVREDSTREINAVADTGAAASKEPPTTKDDMVRLLSLRTDCCAQMHWANAAEGHGSRGVTDARNSSAAPDGMGGSMAEPADPYGSLADIFNNYVEFTPENQLIVYVDGKPASPYRPVHAEVTALAAVCHELNPTNMTRKDIHRPREWIKKHWRSLKDTLHAIMCDFERSGTNRGDKNQNDAAWFDDAAWFIQDGVDMIIIQDRRQIGWPLKERASPGHSTYVPATHYPPPH
ncbi:hypothetical protein B484DRAFT_170388 [Ochromonadaceae sp. CCMP2298]|nr:hypothetical protein B484DRAFT_170388 [Ochromonadaceae sp. CCMP2298]